MPDLAEGLFRLPPLPADHDIRYESRESLIFDGPTRITIVSVDLVWGDRCYQQRKPMARAELHSIAPPVSSAELEAWRERCPRR